MCLLQWSELKSNWIFNFFHQLNNCKLNGNCLKFSLPLARFELVSLAIVGRSPYRSTAASCVLIFYKFWLMEGETILSCLSKREMRHLNEVWRNLFLFIYHLCVRSFFRLWHMVQHLLQTFLFKSRLVAAVVRPADEKTLRLSSP